MKFMYFSIKYRYSDILLKKHKLIIYDRLFCCNHTCYCVKMLSVMSVSHCQSRWLYIRGLIPWNSTELAEAVPIAHVQQQFTVNL